MIRPMPSPAGSNIEKLYILRGRGSPNSPQAAYDAAPHQMSTAQAARYGAQMAKRLLGPKLAYDAAPVDPLEGAGAGASNSDAVSKICEWALSNLTPADVDALIGALGRDRADMGLDRRHAMDAQRRPSRGMSASASASFNEMFPDAARIRTL